METVTKSYLAKRQRKEGGKTMKVVNPVGRTVNTGTEAHLAIQPRACMCAQDQYDFIGTRGSGDNCTHCGCTCGMRYDNDFVAQFTFRKSP